MARKRQEVILVFVIMLLLTACTDQETKLAKLSSYLSSGLQAAIDTQILLHRDGLISTDEDRTIGVAILRLNSSGKTFNDWLIIYRQNKADASKTQLQQILAGIQQGSIGLADAIHVKNPEAQKKLDIIIKTLNLALNLAIELQKPGGA